MNLLFFRKYCAALTAALLLFTSTSFAALPQNFAAPKTKKPVTAVKAKAAVQALSAAAKSNMPDLRWDLIAENAEQFVIPSKADVQEIKRQRDVAKSKFSAQQLGPCDCPCDSIPITAADFQVGGVGPLSQSYFIVAPGTYKLCEDIAYNPAASGTFAIYILSSNVDLDLGTHTLSLATGNLQYASGVFIGPGIDNISIVGQDSTIENFALGIYAPGPNNIIAVRDITVRNCGSDVRANGVFPVDGGIILGAVPTGPVNTAPVTDVLISNIRVLNNKNYGLIVELGAEDIIIKDSIIDGTFSTVPTFQIVGLYIQATSGQDQIPRLKNAQVIGTTVTNTICNTIASFAPGIPANGVAGAAFSGIDNLRVSESTFSDSVCAANNNDPIGPFITYSVAYLQGGITNFLIEDSFFADAVGDPWVLIVNCFHTSANNFGLMLPNNRTIRNCVASGASGYVTVVGFELAYGSNMIVENCQSMNHKVVGAASTLFNIPRACGFSMIGGSGNSGGDSLENNIRGNLSELLIKNCSASDMEAAYGVAMGFVYSSGSFNKYLDDAHTILAPPVQAKNISFIDCVAQKCVAHSDTTFFGQAFPAVAAGFLVENGILGYGIQGIDVFNDPQFYKLAECLSNVFVQNCHVSQVCGAGEGKRLSGGIVMLAVNNATITGNNVTATNNAGILLGGGKGSVPNLTNGEFRFTKNSLVEGNTSTSNRFAGYKNIHRSQNAFVDNISYNNKHDYVRVADVVRNNNRSF